ncbi:isochorismatase hydrolase [Halovivax asiaticus JCM 14624]|uniref:Isochorismatase hydrolase n=1 Tax=Halovivax asiaticus JCM 14624 TaxID=1227490 RepID=M0BGR7_9EURY|nr:isochorismatase family cysteine hydrolase [Halovivax asiaticus]ELZ10076.1 isochorismatase hydrolase [Halovivax asiaticus JCM 14624]
MELDPDETAVIVVDMQNDFAHPDGALYAPGSADVTEPIASLVERAADAGASVVFTRDVHPPEQFDDAHYYDEFDQWGEHVVADSWGAEFVAGLPADRADHVVEKHTYDAFQRTELEGWLAARGIRDLLFCGTLANVCVLHTAGSAGLRDFRPILLADCIGAIEDDHHEYALEHAEWLFGEVHGSDAVSFA